MHLTHRRRLIGALAAALCTLTGLAVSNSAVQATPNGNTLDIQILSFNDFHGNLEPPSGSSGRIVVDHRLDTTVTPAKAVDVTQNVGGVEYLATHLAEARKGHPYSLTVAAGDIIGASPLLSAAFHDEPSIEALNLWRMDVTSVGNHEFDEGVPELLRLQNGGCHPVDGCQDGDPYFGADFPYLAANTVYDDTGETILPATTVRTVQGVKVGFVGMTLEGTPSIVNPAAVSGVTFLDEIVTANKYADELLAKGVEAIVLLIHEGGSQSGASPIDPSACGGFSGPLVDIVAGLDPEFDLVVSGHTHRPYVCQLPDSGGEPTVTTSAGTNGQLVTDIKATLSKSSGDFTSVSATNVIVENGIKNPDGTYQRVSPTGPFVLNPALVDPATKTLVDKYRVAVAPIANRIVGSVSADIPRTANAAQESAMGDVIADAQLAYTQSAGAQIAFMNPGGIRAEIAYANSPGGEAPGQVTYGEVFAVQPFNNLVTTVSLTGQQIKNVLEQQRFPGTVASNQVLILQVSAGFTYSYDGTQAPENRVSNMALNGLPIDLGATYRVTMNDFLANGGDGLTRFTAGTNRVYQPGFDVDALAAYLNPGPVAPGPQNRITRIA
jgi:5'-nucleotidase